MKLYVQIENGIINNVDVEENYICNVEVDANTCPLCNYSNPEEADYCVKCGSPLIFKKQFERNNLKWK